MSGLVRVRYCKAPTILLYCVASLGPRGVPSCIDNFSLVLNGVVTGLHSDMLTLFNKSEAYLSYVSIIPSRTFVTSMPRK